MSIEDKIATLYDAIKHGDDEHKTWLKEAIEAHFADKPIPPPRGQGNKEKRIEELEAENQRLHKLLKDNGVIAITRAGPKE